MAEPTNEEHRPESLEGNEAHLLGGEAPEESQPIEPSDPQPVVDGPQVQPLPSFIGGIADQLRNIPTDSLAISFVVAVAAAILLPNLQVGFFDCWETHYGEVAREMVVRDDYLYPHWKNAYFFSKPVLLLWLMATGFNIAGATGNSGPLPEYTELFARLPISLIALFCVVAVYLAMSRVFNRRAGIFAAIALVTSPMFLMIGRQAITDMPYVGLFSAGLCFFMISVFGEGYQKTKWKKRVHPVVIAFFLAVTLPQYWIIIRSVKWLTGQPFASRIGAFAVCAVLLLGIAYWLYKKGTDSALMMFYILVGLAFLGKGVGGFALPGLIILSYLIMKWDWGMLRRVQLLKGALLFAMVSFPWYVVLTAFQGQDDEHKTFFQRFWIHDHLNRVAVGVHGEKGTFEYFMRQLGFGTLSWAAIMPVALFDAMRQPIRKVEHPKEKARIFLVIWAVALFIFFTAMQTKFHHYVLPVVPPLAMLAGLWLSKLWDSGKIPSGLLYAAIAGMTLLVAADGIRQPWAFIDMFTYHYISYKPEYYFPRNFPYHMWIGILTGIGVFLSLSVILYGHRDQMRAQVAKTKEMVLDWSSLEKISSSVVILVIRTILIPVHLVLDLMADLGNGISRLVGGTPGRGLVLTFSATGLMLGIFMSQVYFLQLAPHWSQRYLYNTYWTDSRPGEPNLAYLMNWRGETFYALNTDIQIKNANDLKAKLKSPGRKYIIVESKRYKGLTSTIREYKDKIEVIDRSNSKWYLVRINE